MRIILLISVLMLARIENAGAELEQRTQSFTISLKGSVAEVTPLLGPVRETEWAPGWAPHFLHPPEAGQREGAVFTTTTKDGRERLWLLTPYDVEQGQAEYVSIAPRFTATQTKIQATTDGN